ENLAAKAFDVDAGDEVGWEHFDDDVASQRRVARHEDSRHTSTTQLPLDAIRRSKGPLDLILKVGHGRRRSGGWRGGREKDMGRRSPGLWGVARYHPVRRFSRSE